MTDINNNFQNITDILKNRQVVKPPAYEWQDFALKIIKDLAVPAFKRSAVFKVCRDLPKSFVEKALIDTRELCKTGSKWQYFFKVISSTGKNNPYNNLKDKAK